MTSRVPRSEPLCMPETAAMTGEQLIDEFERGTTPESSFHHADHVRLAFEYLERFPPLDALKKFSEALRNYAAARGKTGLYHETITWAYLFLIRERMTRAGRTLSWPEFAAQNDDLLVWRGGILDRLYSRQTLDSPLARSVFVFPDRGR